MTYELISVPQQIECHKLKILLQHVIEVYKIFNHTIVIQNGMDFQRIYTFIFEQLNDGSWFVLWNEDDEIDGNILLRSTFFPTLSSTSLNELFCDGIRMDTADDSRTEKISPDEHDNRKLTEIESSGEELYDSLESEESYLSTGASIEDEEDSEDGSDEDSEGFCRSRTYTLEDEKFVHRKNEAEHIGNEWNEIALSGISGTREEILQYYERTGDETSERDCKSKDNVDCCFGNEDVRRDNTPLQYPTESEAELEQLSYSDKSSPRRSTAANSAHSDLATSLVTADEKFQMTLDESCPQSTMEQTNHQQEFSEQSNHEQIDTSSINRKSKEKSSLLAKVRLDDDMPCEKVVNSLTPLIEVSEPDSPSQKRMTSFKEHKLNCTRPIISPIALEKSSQFISQVRGKSGRTTQGSNRLEAGSAHSTTASDSTESFRRNELAISSICSTPSEFVKPVIFFQLESGEGEGEKTGDEQIACEQQNIISKPKLESKPTTTPRPSRIPTLINKVLSKSPSPNRCKPESKPHLEKKDGDDHQTTEDVGERCTNSPVHPLPAQCELSLPLKHSPTTILKANDVPFEMKSEPPKAIPEISPSNTSKQSWADCVRNKEQSKIKQNIQPKPIKNFIALNKAQLHRAPGKKTYTEIFLERKAKAEAKRRKEMEEALGVKMGAVEDEKQQEIEDVKCDSSRVSEVKCTDNLVDSEFPVADGLRNELGNEDEKFVTTTFESETNFKDQSEKIPTETTTNESPTQQASIAPQNAALSTLSAGFISSCASEMSEIPIATQPAVNENEVVNFPLTEEKVTGDSPQIHEDQSGKQTRTNRCRRRKKRFRQKSITPKEEDEESRDSDKSTPRQKVKPKRKTNERSSSLPPLQREDQNPDSKSNAFKPYTLKDYRQLQLDIHLGGLGPNSERNVLQEKLQKYQRQANYAQQVMERNRKLIEARLEKARTTYSHVAQEANDLQNDIGRKRALDYAKNIRKRSVKLEPNLKDENMESNLAKSKTVNKQVKLPPLKSTTAGTPTQLPQTDSIGEKSIPSTTEVGKEEIPVAGATEATRNSHFAMNSLMENVEKLRERHAKDREIVEQLFKKKSQKNERNEKSDKHKEKKNNRFPRDKS